MSVQDYIEERMKVIAINIDEFEIGQELVDSMATVCKTKNKNFTASDGRVHVIKNSSYDGTIAKITNKTLNTIEVSINRKSYVVKVDYKYVVKTEGYNLDGDIVIKDESRSTKIEEIQSKGVDCKQWFTMDRFNSRFKKI